MKYQEILLLELRSLFTNPAILLTVFGGVLLYFFLYPLPYTQQVPRNQEVVVVNLDNSRLSRQFERMVNATPQVHLSTRAYSLREAKEIFLQRKLAGILVIPENFYRDLLLGHRPALSFAGDASYFLVYSTVLEGMTAAGNTLAAQVKIQRMINAGQPITQAERQYSAIRLNLVPVFNQTMGYVNYVIPPVFILILHQTLIMAAGILGSGQNEPQPINSNSYWRRAPPWRLLVIRSGMFMGVYWFLTLYYLGFSFSHYSIPRLADAAEL
ncbi:MAG: ABC transporter permease, partial [Desulfopila sp.]|nr:ABC transporter permease [Desulfopila sp.]